MDRIENENEGDLSLERSELRRNGLSQKRANW